MMLIGPEERKALADLRELASEHPIDMKDIATRLETDTGQQEHFAQLNRQTIFLPFGYAVTYSVEHNHPCGTCRHMSMSTPTANRVPSPDAVAMICAELGFVGGFENSTVWIEEAGEREAVNVVQPLLMASQGNG